MKTKNNKDLPDSPADNKHLQQESFIIDLPGLMNIPGQENIMAIPSGELDDTTIPSSDDDAEGIVDDQDEMVAGHLNANVTKDERKLLDDAATKIASSDQLALENAKLDQYDEDGDALNEKTGLSGNDLDVPGSELDDNNEKIGEEDEENNSYSLDDEHEDDNNTRQ
ncbi:MAG: hypothetical protein ACXWWC_06145 [Chitinophagaceae bacterium]